MNLVKVIKEDLNTSEVEIKKNLQNIEIDNKFLYQEVRELRFRKTEEEIKILQQINKLSTEAHHELMKVSRPGNFKLYKIQGINECELEAVFHYFFLKRNIKHMAYQNIICGGERSAVNK